nr:MAG TPA: Spore cortex-lytic enzyme, lytic transglycosylase [Caudoviricetes sp.]
MLTMFVEPEPEVVAKYSSYEVTLVCQTVYGEARGCSREEQMLVVWCICNRADSNGASIEQVVTAPRQFHGYNPEHPVPDEIRSVVLEVLDAWSRGQEALVYEPYATTSEYLYFSGDGAHNWFREEY